jgi:hypothetical protein
MQGEILCLWGILSQRRDPAQRPILQMSMPGGDGGVQPTLRDG